MQRDGFFSYPVYVDFAISVHIGGRGETLLTMYTLGVLGRTGVRGQYMP